MQDESGDDFFALVEEKLLGEEAMHAVQLDSHRILIVRHQEKIYVVENKCGHFGVPLADGRLEEGQIFCAVHGIGFDLEDGTVSNRLHENCSPIRVFPFEIRDGQIGISKSNL